MADCCFDLEGAVVSRLRAVPGPRRVLYNLYIPVKSGTSQIDALLIHPTGIYVWECKDFRGWISGREQDFYWTQTFKRGRRFQFYSPVRQNRGHINALKQLLNVEDNRLFYSCIVFGDDCTLQRVQVARPQISVVQFSAVPQLLTELTKYRFTVLSPGQVYGIYDSLLRFIRVPNVEEREHAEAVRKLQRYNDRKHR